MQAIGSRELKTRLSEVLRDVQKRRTSYAVTVHGKPVARLVPEPEEQSDDEFEAAWTALDELAAEIGQSWPTDVSAGQAISEDRREL